MRCCLKSAGWGNLHIYAHRLALSTAMINCPRACSANGEYSQTMAISLLTAFSDITSYIYYTIYIYVYIYI